MDTFSTPGKTRVVVTNPLDGVDVQAEGSGTTTVELIAHGDEGEAIAKETTVTCAESNGVYVVTVSLPGQRTFSRRRGSLDVRITAPEGTDVDVGSSGTERSIRGLARGGGSEVRLAGTVGDVDVALPSADLTAHTVSGQLGVKTASGDVQVGTVGGAVKIRTVSGDVFLCRLDSDASLTLVSGDVEIGTANGSLDLTSVSGDVTVDAAHVGASIKSTSGDIVVRTAWSGTIRCATVSGDVTVGIAPGRGVAVEARSMSGDLSSEIDLGESRSSEGGDGTVVRVKANSVSGDIEILRSSAAAANAS